MFILSSHILEARPAPDFVTSEDVDLALRRLRGGDGLACEAGKKSSGERRRHALGSGAGPGLNDRQGAKRVAGGYLRVTNTGAQPDRLAGGSFALSGRVEVHAMEMDGSVMRMRQLPEGLEIKPGQSVELKLGGLHLMFMELKSPVIVGKPIKGALTFEKAGSIEVEFTVVPIGATAPSKGGHRDGHESGHGHGSGHAH